MTENTSFEDDLPTTKDVSRRSRTADKRQWVQDTLFELEEMAEFYEDLPEVRL